jgi:hypothetical protein
MFIWIQRHGGRTEDCRGADRLPGPQSERDFRRHARRAVSQRGSRRSLAQAEFSRAKCDDLVADPAPGAAERDVRGFGADRVVSWPRQRRHLAPAARRRLARPLRARGLRQPRPASPSIQTGRTMPTRRWKSPVSSAAPPARCAVARTSAKTWRRLDRGVKATSTLMAVNEHPADPARLCCATRGGRCSGPRTAASPGTNIGFPTGTRTSTRSPLPETPEGLERGSADVVL